MSFEYGTWSHDGRDYNVAFAGERLFIEKVEKPNLVGGIAIGKVDRVIGSSAYLRLPHAAMGYLEARQKLQPGDRLQVQVSGYATGDKAWPLSTEIKLQSRGYIYLPYGKGIAASKKLSQPAAERLKANLQTLEMPGGWIIRSRAEHATEQDNASEAQGLLKRAEALTGDSTKTWLVEPPAIHERALLESADANLCQPDADDLHERMWALLNFNIPVTGGGHLRMLATPAFFAIDVDGGSDSDIDLLATNAARDIIRVIESRNIAGQIIIDPLRKDRRKVLLSTLKRLLPSDITLYGQTKMGMIELSRPRFGPSLYDALDD